MPDVIIVIQWVFKVLLVLFLVMALFISYWLDGTPKPEEQQYYNFQSALKSVIFFLIMLTLAGFFQ